MKLENIKVYDMEESFKACKYSYAVDTDAVNGELTDRLSYLVKASYREGWGTYMAPLPVKHHSFDAMLQGTYAVGPWQFSAAYALDKGNIYGDCSSFNLKIDFHGKIL